MLAKVESVALVGTDAHLDDVEVHVNAYVWWTVGQITFFAGIGMVVAGLAPVVLVALGFRHARRAAISTRLKKSHEKAPMLRENVSHSEYP